MLEIRLLEAQSRDGCERLKAWQWNKKKKTGGFIREGKDC